VIALMDDWHHALQWLVQMTDVSTVTAFAAKTLMPIQPSPTQKVTLLGDALHNMTPFRGIGANTALRDAAALHRALVAVTRGQDARRNAPTSTGGRGIFPVRTSDCPWTPSVSFPCNGCPT
jgi:2-polyprenyl-6-methoxyphenol hydroxylase-like FAD-dependent oxidoreductase